MQEHQNSERLVVLAQQLYNEYYASCFWHLKPDLVITEAMIPVIVKGLCKHGGRKGMQAASKLQSREEA